MADERPKDAKSCDECYFWVPLNGTLWHGECEGCRGACIDHFEIFGEGRLLTSRGFWCSANIHKDFYPNFEPKKPKDYAAFLAEVRRG